MRSITQFAGGVVLATGALFFVGCQDQNDHDHDMTTRAHYAQPTSPNGISGESTRQASEDSMRYGNQAHSGTLGGAPQSDPNANTIGGGH